MATQMIELWLFALLLFITASYVRLPQCWSYDETRQSFRHSSGFQYQVFFWQPFLLLYSMWALYWVVYFHLDDWHLAQWLASSHAFPPRCIERFLDATKASLASLWVHSSLEAPSLSVRSPLYSDDAMPRFHVIGSPSTDDPKVSASNARYWLSADKPSGIRGAEASSQQRRIL